jgi:hypothetical protein
MWICDCKTPAEHAEHLRKEAGYYNRMFKEPLRYYVKSKEGDEIEVSREEFFNSFEGKDSSTVN